MKRPLFIDWRISYIDVQIAVNSLHLTVDISMSCLVSKVCGLCDSFLNRYRIKAMYYRVNELMAATSWNLLFLLFEINTSTVVLLPVLL